MNHSQRVRCRRRSGAVARQLVPEALMSARQSPITITDIRTLTRLVFESYQANYSHSSPKVQRRYQKLISELTDYGKHSFKSDI